MNINHYYGHNLKTTGAETKHNTITVRLTETQKLLLVVGVCSLHTN